MTRRRTAAAVALASTMIILLTGAVSPEEWSGELPAEARPGTLHYVALGDSFSSGEGAPYVDSIDLYQLAVTTGITDVDEFLDGLCDDRLPAADQCRSNAMTEIEDDYGWLGETRSDGGNGCHRSQHSYPVRAWGLLDRISPGWGVTFAACSGAVTPDVYGASNGEPPQIAAFENGPADLVTVGFGGNNIGFADLIASCLGETFADRYAQLPYRVFGNIDLCRRTSSPAVANAMLELRSQMDEVLTSVASDENLKPGGRVMVVGYPRLFPEYPPGGCSTGAGTSLGPDTMRWLNELVDELNGTLRASARASGAAFIDTTFILEDASRGYSHGVCTDDASERWINRFVPSDYKRSFHPEFEYHDRVAREVLDCWNTCLPTRRD